MVVEIVNEIDEALWRHYVDQQPAGNIFHTPEMFQVFQRTQNHHPEVWAAMDNHRQILALHLPVQIATKGGMWRGITTRSVAYGSVLYTPEPPGKEALALLLKTYLQRSRHHTLFTQLRNLNDLSAIQPLLNQNGFIQESHLNYLIDLNRPIGEIWQTIQKGARKSIRRAIHRGVEVAEVQVRSDIPVFYDLLQQTYRRARIPLADISFFEAVLDILVPKGMARMLLARIDGHFAAVSLEMPYKKTIYSMYSGFDWIWRSVYPNDFLVWHILKWGAQNGFQTYDFGGAGKPGEKYSVRDFKAKFGGRLVQYDRNTYVHAPWTLFFSQIGYAGYRQMMRYLPGV